MIKPTLDSHIRKDNSLGGADFHMEVMGHIRREVDRIWGLSEGGVSTRSISDIMVNICHFVDECVSEWKITEKNKDKALSYNIPFWTQALLKKSETILQFDTWDKTTYDENKQMFPMIPLTKNAILNELIRFVPNNLIWWYLLKNKDEVQAQYDNLIDQIEKRGFKKVVFLGNHATWLNHPMAAYFLTRRQDSPIQPHLLNTIVGPAIPTTRLTTIGATLWSKVIKTWPDTERWMTEFPNKNRVRANFSAKIHETNEHKEAYYLISPAWTTDIQRDGRNIIPKPSVGTMDLLEYLRLERFTFIVLSTNDLEIMQWNASLKPWNAYVRWEICKNLVSALESLPKLVVDKDGKSIWMWE